MATWTTCAFNSKLYLFGRRHRRLLQKWFSAGVYTSLVLMACSTMFFLYNLGSTWVHGQERSLVRPVLSAATASGDSSQWAYLSVGVALGVGVHELGHALAAASEGVPMGHCSIFVAAVLLGAYITLDPETLRELPPWRALRVFCAGVWHNAVAWLACLLLLLTLPAVLAGAFTCGRGLLVMGTPPRSPLGDRFPPGSVITAVGDCPVRSLADWHACLDALRRDLAPACGGAGPPPAADPRDTGSADGHADASGIGPHAVVGLGDSSHALRTDDSFGSGADPGPGLVVRRALLSEPVASFPASDVPAFRAANIGSQHVQTADGGLQARLLFAAQGKGAGDGSQGGESGSLPAGVSSELEKGAAKCLAQGRLPFLLTGSEGDLCHLHCLLGEDVATAPSCHPAEWRGGSLTGSLDGQQQAYDGSSGGDGRPRPQPSNGFRAPDGGRRHVPCASIREAQLAGHPLACVTPMLPPCMVLARVLVALPDGAVAVKTARARGESGKGGDSGAGGQFVLMGTKGADHGDPSSHRPAGHDADDATDYSACVLAQVYAGARQGRAAQRRLRGFQPTWEVLAAPVSALSQSLYLSDYIPRKVWYWLFGIGSVAVPSADGGGPSGPLFPRLASAVLWFPYRLERLLGVLLQVSLSLALVNCVPAFFLDGQPMFSALLTYFTPRWSVVQHNVIIFPVLLLGTLLVVLSVAMAWAGQLWSIMV